VRNVRHACSLNPPDKIEIVTLPSLLPSQTSLQKLQQILTEEEANEREKSKNKRHNAPSNDEEDEDRLDAAMEECIQNLKLALEPPKEVPPEEIIKQPLKGNWEVCVCVCTFFFLSLMETISTVLKYHLQK
jgi:hypothetical protein